MDTGHPGCRHHGSGCTVIRGHGDPVNLSCSCNGAFVCVHARASQAVFEAGGGCCRRTCLEVRERACACNKA